MKGELAAQAISGAEFRVRVTPRARKSGLTLHDGVIHIAVNAPAEDGKANAAVIEALAHALGVAKSRLTLIRGATSRDKVIRLQD